MIEKSKRVLSLFLVLTLVFSVVSVAKIDVSAINTTEIKQKIDAKKTTIGYIPGAKPPSPSSYSNGKKECKGFADAVYRDVFGHGLPSTASNKYQYSNYSSTLNQVGKTLTISSGTLTTDSLKNLFLSAQVGDVVQMDYTNYEGKDSLHTMIVYSVSSTGVVFYHAGSSKVFFGASSGSQPLWGTTGNVLTWAKLKAVLKSSDDGISVYRSKQASNNSSGSVIPHTCSSFTYYNESAHPHRQVKTCTVCGYASYTGSNGTVSSCSSCNYSSTNPDDYTYPTRTLKYTSPTMKGSDVAWVQAVLKKLGYSVTIDGSYGPATRDTIKQFQKAYGLEVDGFCGPKTRAKLLELWNKIKHTHSYTGTVTKSPACTTTGVKTFKCSCGASYTQSIAALGHLYSAYWTVDKAATCTQTGVKSRHCGRCSSRTDITTIPAKGHTSSGWITDTTASVYSAGIKHRECTVCGTVLETVKTAQAVPTKVKLGKISNTASGVKITWSKAAGADTYQIFRRISSSSWEYIGETSSTAYTDKTAKSGTAYYYTVRGINEGGNGSYDTKGLYIRCVGTPKLTKISNATTSVKITWSKVAGADGYYVYRKASGATSWTRIANVKKGSTTSYKDTKVSSGKNYTYTVKAYDGGTKSSHDSKGLTIKFLATPKLLYVTTGKSGITVKWDKVTGATGYIVYRKTGSGSWVKIATVKGNSKVSYLDKTAKKGKTYTYTVKAYNGDYKSYHNTKGLKIKDKY